MYRVILVIFALSAVAVAQTPEREAFFLKSQDLATNINHSPMLTGVLSEDLFATQPDAAYKDSIREIETRSALEAGFFSLVIPGAGQAYNRDYWTAAAFFAVEVAAISANLMWTQKAKNQETYYKTYADGTASDNYQNAHYSVVRYAQWIKNNYVQLEQLNGTTPQGQQVISQWINDLIPDKLDPTKSPWSQVNWYALNQIEGSMGGYFSHQLFPHGNFEYYELIGKYPQFRQGWADSPYAVWVADGSQGTAPIDYSQADTPFSGYYMDQRGKANSLFSVASTALGVVIANHFASAIEAAIAAHVYNKNVHAHVSMTALPIGMGYQAQLQLGVDF